ncbi:MAG TPA: hypothetical protein VF884_14420 [Nitrososphaeraceae archaeon]
MRLEKSEDRFLNELVADCVTYNLREKEALEYIDKRFGRPIKPRSYQLRKANLLSENTAKVWLQWFTRIGFVQNHKEQMEIIRKILGHSLGEYDEERAKEKPDVYILTKLTKDIRANVRLLCELGLGTSIIAAIKERIDLQ